MIRLADMLRFTVLALTLFALADTAHAARRVALVVGNANYENFRDLNNPGNDATDMAALLHELGFDLVGGKAHLNISRGDFSSLVLEFGAALGNGDVGLFYYAGHGAAYDGHNYLIPVNDEGLQYREQVPDFGFDAQRVLSAMRGRSAGTNLIILDACRDNPLPARVAGRDLGKDRGLVPMTGSNSVGRNDLFIYAAEPGQKALDGIGRNGVFTGALLKALRQPNLEINQVLQLTAREVGADAPLPWWEGRSTEALVLNVQKRAPVVSVPSPSASDPVPARVSTALTPQMVTIPSGRFEMGSPVYEEGRESDESPLTTISVTSFRLAKYEVTVGEFRRFVDATGYRTDAEKDVDVPDHLSDIYKGPNPGCRAFDKASNGWVFKLGSSWREPGFAQADTHPVVCVSWRDARAYIEWLNRETDKGYRLPSEAEQEYAIRARSKSPYAWGADANQACGYANVADQSGTPFAIRAGSKFPYPWRADAKQACGYAKIADQSDTPFGPNLGAAVTCNDGSKGTSAVGRYEANGYGLYDTVGNALEWGEDCYRAYPGGNRGSNAVEETSCERRVLRGAAWNSSPARLRSAYRKLGASVSRSSSLGFRLAEDL